MYEPPRNGRPVPPRKSHRWIWVTLTLLACVVVAVSCAALIGRVADSPANIDATPPTASGTPKNNSSTRPADDLRYEGTCDLDAGDINDFALTSEVSVNNRSSDPIKVAVTVAWPQYGGKDISMTKTVSVPGHKVVVAKLRKHASSGVIERAQQYQLKHDLELDCKYKAAQV